MFQLIATILVLGATDPVMVLKNNRTFETEAVCQGYFDTEQGKLDKMKLDALMAANAQESGNTYKAEFSCVALKSDGGI